MIKKILKIIGFSVLILLIILYTLFNYFTAPKSDVNVLEAFKEVKIKPILTHEKYKKFDYRKLTILRDTTLPTLVFVHGTIGSCTDFSAYMKDSVLQTKVNMIAYDRVGYNYKDKNPVQENIAFEAELLENMIKDLPKCKTILVGYSYGGPIALAVKDAYKKIILLAPAVYSKVEPMPWMLNFYKWKATRWLVPKIWKEASKEKLSHREDLENFEMEWSNSSNEIISVHGKPDWIVPYSNSLFLQEQFDSEQFILKPLEKAGHGLIWSDFEIIKQEFLNQLD